MNSFCSALEIRADIVSVSDTKEDAIELPEMGTLLWQGLLDGKQAEIKRMEIAGKEEVGLIVT